jgi:serine/threonine-protein kinase HipA
MRKAVVLYKNIKAGILTETNDGDYLFEYDHDYIQEFPKQFISFSFPVNSTIYKDKRLFPFFEGLIPEGWLLDIATKNWKINANDRMGLLLACCSNCIGAISVESLNSESDE